MKRNWDLRKRVLYDFVHGLVLNMDDDHDPELMQQLKIELEKKWEGDLTLEEKLSLEHIRLHEEHEGHELMHFGMAVTLVITLIIAQLALFFWKRWRFKSYQLASLIGLWVIPVIVCVKNQWWRFVGVWLFFSVLTGIIFKKSLQKPIGRTIPRLVYRWFYYIHKISYASGILGYTIVMATIFGFNFCFDWLPDTCMDYGTVFVFYGLYFGVLGRDVAEICSDKMALQMGYYSTNGIPTRSLRRDVCAVCGNEMTYGTANCMTRENTFRLPCTHKFHEFCIRGWFIIGKKQTCPCCKEKVDLQKIFRNPWQRTHILYTRLLDLIRYMVSWQPLILTLAQVINWILGLK